MDSRQGHDVPGLHLRTPDGLQPHCQRRREGGGFHVGNGGSCLGSRKDDPSDTIRSNAYVVSCGIPWRGSLAMPSLGFRRSFGPHLSMARFLAAPPMRGVKGPRRAHTAVITAKRFTSSGSPWVECSRSQPVWNEPVRSGRLPFACPGSLPVQTMRSRSSPPPPTPTRRPYDVRGARLPLAPAQEGARGQGEAGCREGGKRKARLQRRELCLPCKP